MEECEALCTRLAIMVNGQIKCLGSTQHLKSRFGQGFTVLAKVSTRDGIPDMMPLKQFMETQFPSEYIWQEWDSEKKIINSMKCFQYETHMKTLIDRACRLIGWLPFSAVCQAHSRCVQTALVHSRLLRLIEITEYACAASFRMHVVCAWVWHHGSKSICFYLSDSTIFSNNCWISLQKFQTCWISLIQYLKVSESCLLILYFVTRV